MVSIEDTAESMLGHKQTLQSILMNIREIKGIVDIFKNKQDFETASNYNFTGQHTDIAFADENGAINAEVINQIQDEQLRTNVMKSYSDAVNDGYLNFENGQFTLTDKGREHINKDAFKEQFRIDQLRSMSENKAQITLQGKQSDLNVFRYVDNINLHHLAYSDPAAFKRVVSYFEQCQKYDFVKIHSDGTVTPTEKCYQYLNQNKSFDFDISKLNPDNVEYVAKNISDTTKQTTDTVKSAMNDAVNKAKQETAKKASQEVAKKTAQETAKNTSKATVAASSGAATAGVGTVVTAVVDLSSKGIKELNQSADIRKGTPTLQNR